jgi:acetoacetyl-CoA reductase
MGRIAIVTGGTRGIGAAISRNLKAAGYHVIANYAGKDETANKFKEETGIEVIKFDVGNFEACKAELDKIEAEKGAIDIVVNNAGITRDAVLHRMTPEQWDDVIRVNLGSMFNMTRPVIDKMRARGFGRIVNISSVNAQRGQIGQANYCAAKAGIIGFTKALAQENAPKGITVNTIAPGYVDTDMVAAVPEDVLRKILLQVPVGRLGTAEEIARVINFLVSDDAGFITGATISINGGQYMA